MLAQQMKRQKIVDNIRERIFGDGHAITLVIGNITRWASEGRTIPDVDNLIYIDFDDLSHGTIETLKPDVILSPLVTDAFDAFQVVQYLTRFGFSGRYRAVAAALPNLTMIKNEIKSAAPDIDSDIVVIPTKLVSVS